ncbi:MAG TPA: prolyl oligopeptidase family serine peptidase [Ideonella sp.]|nr:prolyl oligopeptidase family serine peptidase [Ideonella sp.]
MRHPTFATRLAALACLATLAACSTSTPPSPAEILAPNANLVAQGIPPVPLPLVRSVEKYTDFRGHGFVDWHPTQREMLVAHRPAGGDTSQLFRLAGPMAEPERLTNFPDPVTTGSYEPRDGHYIVFARSTGGNEAYQLYRLDLNQPRTLTQLTDPDQRHELNVWLHGTAAPGQPVPPSLAIASSVPLDRTAAGGARTSIATTLWLMDPLRPTDKRKLTELPGAGWQAAAVSWDDKQVALLRYISATESQVWLLDLASGQRRQLLPAAGDTTAATYFPAGFERQGGGLFVISDRAGEFREFVRHDLASGTTTRVTGHIPWDISGGSVTDDGRLIALQANQDGLDTLHLFDGATLQERPAPTLPAGNVGTTRFHAARGELAFSLNGSAGPSQLYSLDPASGKVEQWTQAQAAPGVDPASFSAQQVVRWPSFDGRSISGILNLPPARFTGKRPVLIAIHGGPESQATMGFMNRSNYLIEELGIAVIQPNVRGSSGYGKTFLALDNGALREDSVKDIGALFDWIAKQPHLDASRVMVTGGSYGGYMSLAVSTHYADRIAGAIDVVGISNFVSFLNNTESYRRDLRRAEYGDERDPAMRTLLEQISPLTHADRITKPLFVVQGKNDPRVPWTEAEQIVAKARANGTPVWYLRAENEGHGFARKENADFQFYASILFMRQTLLK